MGQEILPVGWIERPTRALFTTATGKTPSKKNPKFYGGDFPFVKPPELQARTVSSGEDKLSQEGAHEARVLPPYSVLVSCIGTLGKVGLNIVPVAFNQQINAILPNRDIALPKFIFYQVQQQSYRENLERLASATTISIVNRNKFDSIPLRVAPFNEQRRIVDKLDTLFAELDQGETELRKVQALLARYRQSVLKAAVTGELTAEWRARNAHRLESGHDLLARILKARRENWQGRGKYKEPVFPDAADLPCLPPNWQWLTLDHVIAEFITGPFGSALHKSDYASGGVPLVNPANIVNGAIVPDETKSVETEAVERLARYRMRLSDVVIGRRGEMGRCAAIGIREEGWLCGTGSFVLRPTAAVDAEFLSLSIRSDYIVSYLDKNAVGTTMKNLNQRILLSAPLAIPSLEEQRVIVHLVKQEGLEVRDFSSVCERELTRSAALRQSLLKDAFAGRLVPQDPADEPASALLARIRAAR